MEYQRHSTIIYPCLNLVFLLKRPTQIANSLPLKCISLVSPSSLSNSENLFQMYLSHQPVGINGEATTIRSPQSARQAIANSIATRLTVRTKPKLLWTLKRSADCGSFIEKSSGYLDARKPIAKVAKGERGGFDISREVMSLNTLYDYTVSTSRSGGGLLVQNSFCKRPPPFGSTVRRRVNVGLLLTNCT